MSDEDSKKIEQLMARVAAMETENAALKKQIVDPSAIARELNRDPLKFLQKYNGNVDHVTKTLVTHALGDQADPVLRAQVGMGPMLANQADLAEEVRALRQRLDASEARNTHEATRAALAKLAADKTKYPHLSTAVAKDASLFDDDVQRHAGTPEELAKALESRLTAVARALGHQPAAAASAEQSTATSEQAGRTGSPGYPRADVPPLPNGKRGFDDEARQALRDEIVRKAERGEYNGHPYSRIDD